MAQIYAKKLISARSRVISIKNTNKYYLVSKANASQALKEIPHFPDLQNDHIIKGIFKGFQHSTIQQTIQYLGYKAAIKRAFAFSQSPDFKNCKLVNSCIATIGYVPHPPVEPIEVINDAPFPKPTPNVKQKNQSSKLLLLHLPKDKYLYNLYLESEAFRKIINNDKRIFLEAPTGAGKTYLSLKIGIELFNKVKAPTIIVFPLNSIVEQQGIKAKKEGYNIPYITAKSKNQLSEIDKNTPVIFCNYDSINVVKSIVLEHHSNYNLIVDEQHLLVNDMSFRGRIINDVQNSIDEAEKVILMSATPVKIGLSKYSNIKVTSPKKDIKESVIYTQNIKESVINNLSKDRLNIVLLNNKKEIDKIQRVLKKARFKTAIIHSDQNEKNNQTYQSLINHEAIPNDVDVLICTSKIATGLNINDTGIDHKTKKQRLVNLIYCETSRIDGRLVGYNKRLKTQFVNRVRKTELIDKLTIIASEQLKNKEKRAVSNSYEYFAFLKNKYGKLQHEEGEKVIEELVKPKSLGQTAATNILDIYSFKNGKIVINENVLRYEALQHEIKHATIELPEIIEKGKSSEVKKQLKVATTEIKEEKKKALGQLVAKIQQIPQNNEFLAIVKTIMEHTNDSRLQELIEQNFSSEVKELDSLNFTETELSFYTSMIKTICKFRNKGVSTDDSIKLITNSKGKLKGREAIKITLDILINQKNKRIQVSKLDFLGKEQVKQNKEIVKALKNSFKRNNGILTSDQIRNEIKYTIQKIKGVDFTDLSNRKAANIAQSFLHLERNVIREKGDDITTYKLIDEWTLKGFQEHYDIKLSKQKQITLLKK